MQPDAWSILANLLYWLLLIVVTLAKVVSLAVVAFGLIASAVCALLGPIFVPFFIVPKLDWLFWSWFKAFIQYSFIPVVAFAFLMIFERFMFQFLTTLPPGITEDLYLVYGLQALVVIGMFVGRHSARPVADEFDLLRPRRRERPARPNSSVEEVCMRCLCRDTNANWTTPAPPLHAVLSDRLFAIAAADRSRASASSGSIAGLLHFHPLW